jgi:hypothetical protein
MRGFRRVHGWERYLPDLFAEASVLAFLFRDRIAARIESARRTSESRARRVANAAHLRVVDNDDDRPRDKRDLNERRARRGAPL